jgi:hypothetical protein
VSLRRPHGSGNLLALLRLLGALRSASLIVQLVLQTRKPRSDCKVDIKTGAITFTASMSASAALTAVEYLFEATATESQRGSAVDLRGMQTDRRVRRICVRHIGQQSGLSAAPPSSICDTTDKHIVTQDRQNEQRRCTTDGPERAAKRQAQ